MRIFAASQATLWRGLRRWVLILGGRPLLKGVHRSILTVSLLSACFHRRLRGVFGRETGTVNRFVLLTADFLLFAT